MPPSSLVGLSLVQIFVGVVGLHDRKAVRNSLRAEDVLTRGLREDAALVDMGTQFPCVNPGQKCQADRPPGDKKYCCPEFDCKPSDNDGSWRCTRRAQAPSPPIDAGAIAFDEFRWIDAPGGQLCRTRSPDQCPRGYMPVFSKALCENALAATTAWAKKMGATTFPEKDMEHDTLETNNLCQNDPECRDTQVDYGCTVQGTGYIGLKFSFNNADPGGSGHWNRLPLSLRPMHRRVCVRKFQMEPADRGFCPDGECCNSIGTGNLWEPTKVALDTCQNLLNRTFVPEAILGTASGGNAVCANGHLQGKRQLCQMKPFVLMPRNSLCSDQSYALIDREQCEALSTELQWNSRSPGHTFSDTSMSTWRWTTPHGCVSHPRGQLSWRSPDVRGGRKADLMPICKAR